MTMNGGGLGIAHLADIEPIDGGTDGSFYTATDLKLDRRVAVRLFEPLQTGAERIRFSEESKVLGSLSSHPNVVTIYDAGFTEHDRPFLIMELIEGQDLGQYLAANGPLPWAQAAGLALQISAGLEQAHRTGTLHRDLRPGNIVMSGTTAKLTDFGISGGSEVVPSEDPTTMQHRAPESLTGSWDERSDLYSLTSTLYELIDGRAPFWRPGEDSVPALQLRLAHEQAPGLSPDLAPVALDRFITAGLSKDRIDRPQTADEFSHELRLIVEGRTTGSTPSVLHGTWAPMADSTAAMSAGTPPAPAVALSAFAPDLSVPDPMIHGAPTSPVPASAVAPAAPMMMSTTISDAPPVSPPAPMQSPDWQPPEQAQWQPPTPTDGTALYSDFGAPISDGPGIHQAPGPYPDLEVPPGGDGDAPVLLVGDQPPEPRRSPVFIAALAMIAIGVLALAAVFALSSLGSDDPEAAAPVLPDPNQPVTVEAESGDPESAAGAATPTSIAEEAMEDGSTPSTEPPEQSSTTETTIQRYQVPNLIGLKVEDASRTLTDTGFQVVVVGRRAVNAEPGTVTQQVPAAGAQVALPLTVTLYIPRVSNLPAMIGRSADVVCLELQALGLTCTRQPMYNDRIPAGSVIFTDPIEGSLFNEGSTVTISVSLGPVLTVAIPNVAGMTEAEAQAALTEAGFVVVIKGMRASGTVEIGRVVGTEPGIGSMHPVDQPVTMLVSSGAPAKVAVPTVVGMTAADASATLTAVGLTATTVTTDLPEGDPGIGTVLTSDPATGTEVDAGSAVTIAVGQQVAAPDENSEG